jgi:uncharacterized protein
MNTSVDKSPCVMSGYYQLTDLNRLAIGLNIEGYRPTLNLPDNCKWYNLIQVIDEPLKGINFDDIMKKVNDNKYEYIEQAIDINISDFIDKLSKLICDISTDHKNILVHIHQFENTTILHKTLNEKINNSNRGVSETNNNRLNQVSLQRKISNIKFITDKTHYFEHPVNYKTDYPNIDALISISQCAGFGLKAGSWIVPTGFMDFDVKNNIIFTNIKYAPNNIEKFIEFEYSKGNILVVNDLWNPDLKIQDGVLLLDKDDGKVLEFVKENTKIFDESHNWQHAVKVAYNSTKILNNKHVLYLALLHDVCDDKYKNAIPRDKLKQYIYDFLPEYKKINEMIEQISFSKQKSFDRVDPIIETVRDGDRLEAIGQIGIERCIQFTESKGGKVPHDVIQHCYDKLLRLVPCRYIVTKIGLQDARKLHNIIVKYVRDEIHKTNLVHVLPEYL